jgi:hypothetical protein
MARLGAYPWNGVSKGLHMFRFLPKLDFDLLTCQEQNTLAFCSKDTCSRKKLEGLTNLSFSLINVSRVRLGAYL